ncbi:MAG: hypothetical protein U1F33_13840 [Alphaproteobacteria bacterium]
MSALRAATLLALSALLAACAEPAPYQPLVDMSGRTEADYKYDLLYCREAARQRDIATGVGIGVLAGAALGPVVGAASGAGAGVGVATGVPAGAVAGGTAASVHDQAIDAQFKDSIDRCMVDRGWTLRNPQPADLSAPPSDLTQPSDAAGSGAKPSTQ